MAELLMFLIVMLGLVIYDIFKMKKANLKREILPYLALTLFAGAIGFVYLINPSGPSIAKILLSLFNIKE